LSIAVFWQILGRASELHAFVKQGTSDGFIEIELKGHIGKYNLIIRRTLNAKSKSSTFTLNGKMASGKEVTQKMNDLNVQVGNLWYGGQIALYVPPHLISRAAPFFRKTKCPNSLQCHHSNSSGKRNVLLETSVSRFGMTSSSIPVKI